MQFLKNLFFAVVMLSVALACESNSQISKNVEMKTQMDSVSYAIGANIGNSFRMDSLDLDLDLVLAGMSDKMTSENAKLTEEELAAVLERFQQTMQEKKQQQFMGVSEENTRKGKEFLSKNRAEEGVKETASGLQYKVIKQGTGRTPKETETVKVHYHGTLINGKVFDSSKERGEPIEFPLNRVIRGWTEGLQLMQEGSIYMLYIPSELAYGARGQGTAIGPNETLIFEVELLEIKPTQE